MSEIGKLVAERTQNGARLSDTWKGDHTKKIQTEFTLKNTEMQI